MGMQLDTVYRDLIETLSAHGATLADVVKETVFTTDIERLSDNAAVRAQFYDGKGIAPPASSWVEVRRLGDPGWLVEVEVVAVID